MVNNLDLIKSLLVFDSEDDFYHLQIIKRKKEHTELGSNSYVVKTYYIRSLEYLDKKFYEIKALCDFHNARACINLNRRSFEKMAFHTLRKVTDQLMNRDYESVRKAYESVCGSYSNEPNKKWILDFDTFEDDFLPGFCDRLHTFRPEGNKFIAKIPTKNGYHVIVRPFDLSEANELRGVMLQDRNIAFDIHKDNPTILYIP